MIGICDQRRISRHTATPSPSGSTRSRIAASGGRTATGSSACSAVWAGTGSKPASRRMTRSARRICGSSSQTRPRRRGVALMAPAYVGRAPRPAARRWRQERVRPAARGPRAAIMDPVPPAPALDDVLAPLLADPSRAAVLLDVDGTLAPIVRHADDAHVPEPTRAPLIAIARRYGLVACVSGRRAATARRIVAIGSITYVGNHGTEILRGGSTEPEVDPEVAAWGRRVRRFAERHFDAEQ